MDRVYGTRFIGMTFLCLIAKLPQVSKERLGHSNARYYKFVKVYVFAIERFYIENIKRRLRLKNSKITCDGQKNVT